MKTWLQDNEIEIYLTCKETKSVVAERFIRNLKYKISTKKNAYIDKLDDQNIKISEYFCKRLHIKLVGRSFYY